MKYLVSLALVALLNFSAGVRADFTGEWVYQYSLAEGGQKLTVDPDGLFTGSKMVFSKCNDSKDLSGMPPVVIEVRKKDDFFSNVKFIAYKKDGAVIDTFYPNAISHSASKPYIQLVAYGTHFKDDFALDYSQKDALAIEDHKVYEIDGVKYLHVRHVYLKAKQ
jgi:hypothetical protein